MGAPGCVEHARAQLGMHLMVRSGNETSESLELLLEYKSLLEPTRHLPSLGYPVVLAALGRCHSQRGEHELATAAYEQSLDHLKDRGCGSHASVFYNEVLGRISVQYHRLGRDREAAQLLRDGQRSCLDGTTYFSDLSYHLLRQSSLECGFRTSPTSYASARRGRVRQLLSPLFRPCLHSA